MRQRIDRKSSRDGWQALALGCVCLLLVAACAGSQASSPQPVAAGEVRSLYDAAQADAAQAGKRSAPPEVEALVSGQRRVAQDDPSWPTITFLVGEIHRQRGNTEGARTAFSELASWAASNQPGGPYGDTWGGSGLAVMGLWRWLQILDEHGPAGPDEVGRALDVAARLQGTRFYSGMVQSGLLPGLPFVAEEVADRLVHVAWKNQRQDLARSLYLDSLAIDSRDSRKELDDIDRQVQAQLLEQGLATRERLDLFRARRQLALVKTKAQKDESARILRKLWDDPQAPADVRAEAGYEWANYQRRQADPDLVPVLSDVVALGGSGPIAAKALYRRGMVQGGEALVADMLELQQRFPKSPLADDALFQVATQYLFRPDVDKALTYYKELREFKGLNDYLDSAYYMPALGLIGRGHGDDLDAADRLLAEYLTSYPNGDFRLRTLFWRGRIAEGKNDEDRARAFFQQVIREAPYDYYGLRARLHLDEGVKAIRQDVPAADSRTRAVLNQAYRAGRVDTVLTGSSPYHKRLETAASTGLYARLLATEAAAQKVFARRLDDVSLAALDARRLTPAVALLLALRQDALAAKDCDPRADNWLKLAGLLGHELQDWPAAIEITFVSAAASPEELTALQTEPRYLATAYPDPASLPRLRASLASAAWTDGRVSTHLSQSLTYAMIRQESRFYAGAISQVGALGLLQMMPQTFAKLDPQSALLKQSGAASEVEYLLDPQRNIATWADWWRTEFRRDDLLVAIMKHNAGPGNVSQWLDTYWTQMGSPEDLEYRVETARFPETRNFLRAVLRDTAIVDAAGFFADRAEQ